jgi:hypothetical protein
MLKRAIAIVNLIVNAQLTNQNAEKPFPTNEIILILNNNDQAKN